MLKKIIREKPSQVAALFAACVNASCFTFAAVVSSAAAAGGVFSAEISTTTT